jgi:hypothetical protein
MPPPNSICFVQIGVQHTRTIPLDARSLIGLLYLREKNRPRYWSVRCWPHASCVPRLAARLRGVIKQVGGVWIASGSPSHFPLLPYEAECSAPCPRRRPPSSLVNLPHIVGSRCTLPALAKRGLPCTRIATRTAARPNTQLPCTAALLTASPLACLATASRRLAALDGTKTAAVEVTPRRTRH